MKRSHFWDSYLFYESNYSFDRFSRFDYISSVCFLIQLLDCIPVFLPIPQVQEFYRWFY